MQHNYKPRSLSKRLKHLFAHFPCVIVVGARQDGKSILLTHLFPAATHILLDPIQDVQNIRRDPDLFLNHSTLPIIFDEVQYAPELIPALKRFHVFFIKLSTYNPNTQALIQKLIGQSV